MTWTIPIEIGITQALLLVWVVLAFSLAYRVFGFPDLTIEGSLPLGAAVYAVVVRAGMPLTAAIVAAVTVGAVVGATTGTLHTRFGVNKFLSGIIVVAISYSLTLRVMSGPNISLIGQRTVLGIIEQIAPSRSSELVVFFLGSLCLLGAWLISLALSSRFGIRMRAAGSNPSFAESVGVSSQASIIIALACTNGLAAFSGVLVADSQGFSDVSSGQGILILALAATAVGETLVPKRWFSYYNYIMIASLVGVILYQLLISLAVRAGLQPTDLRLATGVLVLFVVAFRFSRTERGGSEAML